MDIQKFCLQDGPGIRTTVFLKGCNMKCKWCHNPESMASQPVLMFRQDKCVGCGKCEEICPNGVHHMGNGEHEVDRSKCTVCGKCAEVCLAEALSINGYPASVEEIMKEICKDENYYKKSGGGVTFSGGEATLQFAFLKELLTACGEKGYHRAVETNGLISKERLVELVPLVDLFLFDYKVTGEAHALWTGVPGEAILESLKLLNEKGAAVILRCPIIPGVNDNDEHFEAIRQLKKNHSCIQSVEVMAYHDIGKGKWKECGKTYELEDLKTVLPEQKKLWEELIMQ